jgi:ribosomal protein RSM22 (predicted rRNA methylase)
VAGLPAAVSAVLAARLEGKSRKDLARSHAAISESYRRGGNSAERLTTDDDALAYAAARMPATHAAVAHALQALADATPDLAPASMLDAGCGPGTAAIAAAAAFPFIATAVLLDRNAPLLALAGALVRATAPAIRLDIRANGLDPPPELPDADLCLAAYVLAELSPDAGARLARALWSAARKALVIVEPGTPAGFARMRVLRDMLTGAGAHVAAPCTHHAPCPMAGTGWCRVPVRVERSRDHRLLKDGALGYEDEPVAYLALTRVLPASRTGFRIVGPPRRTKAAIELPACGPDGLTTQAAARRDSGKFKQFRKLDWGDAI